MGDKGQKNKDKHNKQVDIAKNEADRRKQEQTTKNIKATKNFGK